MVIQVLHQTYLANAVHEDSVGTRFIFNNYSSLGLILLFFIVRRSQRAL